MKDKKYQFIAVGSATVDIFLQSTKYRFLTDDDFNNGEKTTICTIYGEKVEVKSRFLASGGGGTNSAVGFSRLGFKTAVAARLGDDCFGKFVVNDLANQKDLDSRWLVVKHEGTDQSLILLAPDGRRTILVYRGPSSLEKNSLPWHKLKADNYYLASLEGNLDLAAYLIDRARRQGARVFWNPGQRELADRKKVLALAAKTHLFLNQGEAEELFAASGARLEQRIRRQKIPLLAVTQGAGGATVFWQCERFYQPTITVPVRDTTGAGDAFGVGFAAAIARNSSPVIALSWGIANAASVIGYPGAKRGLLTLSQLKNFLRRHGRK